MELVFKSYIARFCLLLSLLFAACAADATHFRYSHFTWEARADLSPSTVDFNLTVAFRSSYFGHPNIGQRFYPGYFSFGDGTGGYFTFEVIARNLQEDWIVGRAIQPGNEAGRVRHVYRSASNNGKPWVAYFSGCCRISTLRNSADTSWFVATEVDLSGGNKSPISNLPPIVTCSKYDCRFLIPAVDRDGDQLKWRLASAQSGIRSLPAGMAVDATTGIFTWEGSRSFSNGLYAVQVIIEDFAENSVKKSSVAIDFIINLQDSGANAWPVFDVPPTPAAGSRIVAVVGQAFRQTIQATDPDSADQVFLNHVGLPQRATFVQTVSGGPIAEAVLEWAPTLEDLGQHIVTFLANDNRGGASTPIAVTIDVIEPAISNVRIIDTISTQGITLDASSFSIKPKSVELQGDKTVVTWFFPTFQVGQLESLTAELALFEVTPNERRTVSHNLDVFYIDVNGKEVHQALGELVVKVAPTLTGVSIATDKTVYGPGESVAISTLISNHSPVPANARINAAVTDNQQRTVIDYGLFTRDAIPAKGSAPLAELTFTTTGVHAGMYEAVASIVDASGKVLRRATAPFSLVTENGTALNLGSSVYTDKPVYQAWDQVLIDFRVQNLASNSGFDGGRGELVVTHGDAVVYQERVTLNSLAPSAMVTRQAQLPLADSLGGTYFVSWKVYSGTELLTSSQASFEVIRSELQALLGKVEVDYYETGEPKGCRFATTNRSAAAILEAKLVYQVLQLMDGQLVNEIIQSPVGVSNKTEHSLEVLVADDLPDYGGYVCVLMAEIDGKTQELAASGFFLHPPKLTTKLSFGARGRLLLLLDAPDYTAPHDLSRPAEQITYLENLLSQHAWDYKVTYSAEEFTREFFSGVYSAIALLSEHVVLTPQTEKLVIEAHNSGVGLLIGGALNRRNNEIEKSLGVEITGHNTAAGAVVLAENVLSEPRALEALLSQGVAFGHCSAQTLASFAGGKAATSSCASSGGLAAVTSGQYGNGKNAYFGYDLLDAATYSASLHEDLFLHALQYIQPSQWNLSAGRTVPVDLSVENRGRTASFDASSSLTNGATFSGSHHPMQLSQGDAQALWQWDFPKPSSVTNTLYVQLPTTPQSISLDVGIRAGISRRLMMDYSDTQLALNMPSYASAQHAAVEAVVSLAPDLSQLNLLFVQNKLSDASGYVDKKQSSKAIQPLLLAVDELSKTRDPSAVQARILIDEWLFQIQRQLLRDYLAATKRAQ